MNEESESRVNKTCLRFTQEFKEMIKEIKTTKLVEGLQHGNLDILQETQHNIRAYVRTLYKNRKK